ncbi:MAG: TRAP transporter substrate-binding protein [Gammaproteobacteria bacterium]|nr:TRAP transporter substrate-binding protein [Gammaproteobacteria bacterium]
MINRLCVRPLVSVAIILLLAACGVQPDNSQITVAGTTFPDTEGERHWLHFHDSVKVSADESFSLRMLIYGQLGSEDQLVSGLRRGRVQFANLSAMAISAVVPETALLYAPFLFEDEAEADFVYDNYLTPLYRELLAEKGLHLVSWYEIGFLDIYGIQPLLLPVQANGRRFRVGAGPAARLFANAIGADVIPLGFSDVVASLQTGLIEAGENAVSLYARTGIATEAPHLTLTEHAFGVSAIVASKTWWDSLTLQQQQIITNAWPAIEVTRKAVRAESAQDLRDASTLGIQVHHLSREQRQQWRAVTAPVVDMLIEKIGGRSAEVYNIIQVARNDYKQNAKVKY